MADAFYRATGDRLFHSSIGPRIAPGIPTIHRLAFDRKIELPGDDFKLVFPSADLTARYGDFDILVFEDPPLRDDRVGGIAPDENDIYWEYAVSDRGPNEGRGYWSAGKPYGSNVLLRWTSRTKRTTKQSEHLFEALAELE